MKNIMKHSSSRTKEFFQALQTPGESPLAAKLNRLAYRAKQALSPRGPTPAAVDGFDCKAMSPGAQEVIRRFHDSYCLRNPDKAVGMKPYLALMFSPKDRG
ncbi:MAG: hypothetical protein EOO40_07085 [Deltaproteobacteria bacterium]|nr:MAG: hypothetical protein EOO40_07085 [Deltaproteobacteria bacterium]